MEKIELDLELFVTLVPVELGDDEATIRRKVLLKWAEVSERSGFPEEARIYREQTDKI